MIASSEADPDAVYEKVTPNLELGLPFKPIAAIQSWFDWPTLVDLFPVSFPGAKTNRDGFLVDIDLTRLRARIGDYFNRDLDHEEVARRYPVIMKTASHFDALSTRTTLLQRGGPNESGFVKFAYRPFDTRWLYWEADTKLLNDKRAAYKSQVFAGNVWLEARQRDGKETFSRGTLVREFAGDFGNGLSHFFPLWLRDGGDLLTNHHDRHRPNISASAQRYLDRLDLDVECLFHHVIATLHDSAYRSANAGALHLEWPRIPMPDWPDGTAAGAAEELVASAARGRELAALLDSDTPVAGVTTGALRSELAVIAVPTTIESSNMAGDDFAVSAGWGHFGTGKAVMPGQGRIVGRDHTEDERTALADEIPTLGDTTFDVYLNERGLLVQHSSGRVDLPTRRIPSTQEVALLPGEQGSWPLVVAGRGSALHGHGAKDRRDPDDDARFLRN